MLSLQPRSCRIAALLAVLVLLLVVGGLIPLAGSLSLIATAQINNTQPTQPFASVVNCIRMGSDLGQPSYLSPRFATTCYASRLHDGGYNAPGGDPSNGDSLPSDTTIVEFGDAQPDNTADYYDVPTNGHAALSTVGEIGSVYGLAYQTGTNPAAPSIARSGRLFSAAYHKRLTRFGSGGPGAIYVINRAAGTSSLYVTIPNVVPGPNGLPNDPGDGSQARFPNDPAGNNPYTPEMGGLHRGGVDTNEEGYVGKTSLGDIALDPQEHYLYAVNLNDKNIYRFDTWSSSPQSTMTILPRLPLLSNASSCNASGSSGPQDFRPFALHVTATDLYLGYVCSAEASGSRADLATGVVRFDLASNTWSSTAAIGFLLSNYDAQRGTALGNNLRWNPWATNGGSTYHYPQPILSGIAFAEDGTMLLSFRDRYGDLSSSGRYINNESQGAGQGDLLLATPTSTAGVWNAPGTGAEYFTDGNSVQSNWPSGWIHGESTWGGIAYVPGTHAGSYGGEVASTVISPYRVNSGGVAWWDLSGGNATGREEIYQTNSATANTFQKAAGLGDLELLCAWRAIGDRLWRDTNGNGVQDAGEPDINGVRVQLLDSGGNVVASVTTGAVAGMSGNYRFYVDPFANYTVRIDPAMFNAGQPLAGLALTAPNASGNDATDSDADIGGNIGVAPAGDGDVNVTFDFGLVSGANVRISKSGPATALPGDAVTYNLSYANDGPAAAQNVTVVDTLPTGITFVNANPAPSSVSGQTITWNLGTIASGGAGAITVNASVRGGASGTLPNRVTSSTTTPNDNPGDNTSTTDTTVVRPNVTIQKSGPATVTVGDPLAYTLTYRNTGTANAANVTVVDTLPAGVSFVSANPAPSSVSGQTITWNLGMLATGASGSITVNVQTSNTLANGTTLINQATISTTTPGDDPSDNTSTTTTTAQRADVYITKSSPNNFPVASGSQVTYYLDYGNRGPAAALNVALTDVVPSQITGVSWSCTSGCSGSGSGNSISLNLGTLAAGATGRVTVTGTAQTTLAREDFTNTATIATSTPETDTTNNQSSVPGAVWTTDLQIIKLAQAQVAAGDTFSATLSYRNNGPAPASGAQLTDTLPAGVTFVSSSPSPTSQSGSTLTWNLGTLADQASSTIQLVLRSDPALANTSTVTNQSQISTTTSDRDSSNNSSSAQTVVVTRADVAVTKTGPARVSAGDVVAFTISYTNNGPSVARSVILTDTLPAELDFVSANPAAAANNAGVLTWNLGDLAPSASGTISVQMQSRFAQSTATLTATNQVRITTTTTDPNPNNTTDTHSVAVETVDLSVTKTMPVYVVAGVPFTATLTYANAGPATANSVTLRDLLPSGLTFMSASPPPSGPGLRWNLGTLPAGASGSIAVQLRAPTTTISGTQYLNQAIVDTLSSDRDSSNDIASATTTVRPNADLSVVKTGPAGPLRSGSGVSYTLTYRNAGPSQATNVQIVDTPPPGFTFSSASPTPSSTTGGTLTWSLGNLDAGMGSTITINGTLDGAGTSISRTNTATISSATPDPDPGDNASTTATIVQKPDLSITKTDGVAQVQPGDTLTYTLTIKNTGPITATGVVLSETPPAGVTVADPAWTVAGNGTSTRSIGVVAPGATLTRTFTLALPNPLPASLATAIVNTASVGDDGSGGPDPTPNDGTTTDTDEPIVGRVGDRIWLDADSDGQQDAGETGLANVPLDLLDPATGRVLATTTTDGQGLYRFDGLRLGRYAVRIKVQALAGVYRDYTITTAPIPVAALSAGAPRDDTLDIGLHANTTTAVALAYLLAEPTAPRGYLVRWGTLAERNTSIFRVERSTRRDRTKAVIVGYVPSLGSRGGDYRMSDSSAPESGPVYYWLVEVETNGTETVYGPATMNVQSSQERMYLPLVRR